MKKNIAMILIFIVTVMALSGCMYPKEKMQQNQIPYDDQIKAVQTAVKQFQKDNNGILPIKTRDSSTPIYQKYPIDFKKIVPQYMAEPPGNSFEAGGIFQYVLVDVEKNPAVKIFDLRNAETIRELKIRMKAYKYPPFKDKISKNVFTLDYKKLGYKEEPMAISPYSKGNLPFIITGEAEIYIDYRTDLYKALKETKHHFQSGDDIRDILVKNSHFVPVYSLPYTIESNSNDPIFFEK